MTNKSKRKRTTREIEEFRENLKKTIGKEFGSEEAFWKFIARTSRKSFAHLQLLMHYTYGKPREVTEIERTDEIVVRFERKERPLEKVS